MRNLVFMHLESLDYVNYRVNFEKFPNLRRAEKNSLSFTKYFSSATSTLMVIGDLMYGGMRQFERCDSMSCVPAKFFYAESLFDRLQGAGYVSKIFLYPGDKDCESAKRRHISGMRNSGVETFGAYKEFMEAVRRNVGRKEPFALMLCNMVNNTTANHLLPYGRLDSGLDRIGRGYRFLDDYVGDVLGILEETGQLDNTTVIFYGDHGDEYFSHGYHKGLTHAIEPYADLIHTPFWIYDARLAQKGVCSDLLSTVDLKNVAERLLDFPEESFRWSRLKFEPGKYVLARNAYAAQPVREGTFNKGYSITDGRFLLMAGSCGLEMYEIETDPQCLHNLLELFDYRQKILHINEKLDEPMSHHYRSVMDTGSVRQIRQKFYFLREKLYGEVAMLLRDVGCESRMEELDFDRIRYKRRGTCAADML